MINDSFKKFPELTFNLRKNEYPLRNFARHSDGKETEAIKQERKSEIIEGIIEE